MTQADLALICAKPNVRPRRLSPEAGRVAAGEIADELIRGGMETETEREEIIDDILGVYRDGMDGYQIAKALDRKSWDCDLNMVEMLDGLPSAISQLLDVVVKKWAEENPMEPPHPDGTVVKTPHGIGPIESVYADKPHSFLVLIDGRRLIVAFEDVSLA